MLAESLHASLIDRSLVARSVVARVIRRLVGIGPAQAWLAFRRRHEADVIFADGEHVAIPLALLLRLSGERIKLVAIGHRLSSRKKRLLFRTLRAHDGLDRIALHSRQQFDFAMRELRIGPDRLALVPYQVDTDFWSPRAIAEENLVASAGLEHRDYVTLLQAVKGLDTTVVIAAASHWSRHMFATDSVPSNTRVASFDYLALRDLYARAAVIVVPLKDVDNQAGVTTILEAMAMAKPVIVTQTAGQTDVVEDRRSLERGRPRPRPISLARVLAADRGVRIEPNGFYVAPGDAAELRGAISYLLGHPEERQQLGASGRRMALELFGVDEFASRMRALIHETEGALERRATSFPGLAR